MVSYGGELKLIDFGTARAENRRCHTVAGIVFAKPGYVAPEVANNNPGAAPSDLYAFGVMLWELIAGRRFLIGDSSQHMALVGAGKRNPTPLAQLIGAPPFPLSEGPVTAPGAGSIDALPPPDMARACEAAGAAKAGRDAITLVALGVLAGAFVALGAMFATIALTGAAEMPWGAARILAGLVFSLGLILVIVGGAELFTGDSLMVVACASRRIAVSALLRAWTLVYVGNIAGALGTAALVFLARQYGFGGGAVGETALAIAAAKTALPTVQLFFLAVLCNVLVCLAVWMSFGARSTTDKVMVIVPPVAAFVAAGFEHSIANVYLLPYGLAIKAWAGPEFWSAIGKTAAAYPDLALGGVLHNIVVATVGNLVGGSLMVGAVYWFVYLRVRR
jgi:formate/nitrite transporter